MRDSARRVSDVASRAGRRARGLLGKSAWLLLVLSLLAWSTMRDVRAQDRPPQGAKTPVPAPTAKPVPAAPQSAQTLEQVKAVQALQQIQLKQAEAERAIAVREEALVLFSAARVKRFQFNIPANTPLKDLLPVPPRNLTTANPLTIEDLTRVPEVQFQKPITKDIPADEEMKQTAHMIARINHLNGKKADAFMEALRNDRLDLAGLPFAMGDACRTKGERSKQFARAVATVRGALQQQGQSNFSLSETRVITLSKEPVPPPTAGGPAPASPAIPGGPVPAVPVDTNNGRPVPLPPPVAPSTDRKPTESFWEQYQGACSQEDKRLTQADRCQQETITVARIAALMQVLAPESPSLRLGLVKYLSAVAHVEATRALARLAIFSAEEEVRRAAVDALKVRRERDYTDILLAGLRYPWPKVAKHAADAAIKLERSDLVPQLVALLDEPDPRAPLLQEVNKKQVPVVRELVRVNHHQNCLLCHAPGNTGSVSPETLTAEVPVPGQPLPSLADGYRISVPDLTVRIDVTYLRQDFSAYLPVEDANPWPEMQRFDFLTRTRVLSEDEAASYRKALGKDEPGRPSPYHRAALAALRELTGRDAEPTAAGWRRLLGLPADQRPASVHGAS